MNNSIETAQEITKRVTAGDLLRVLKQGSKHFMHGDTVSGRPSYSDAFVFTFYSEKEMKGGGESRTTINVPGFVSNGHTSRLKECQSDGHTWQTYDEVYRPSSGHWSMWAEERLRDILELLPKDTAVAFHVCLDAGTNQLCQMASAKMQYTTEQGLHADHLYLIAETKRGERKFLLDATVSAHNSARFGGAKSFAG